MWEREQDRGSMNINEGISGSMSPVRNRTFTMDAREKQNIQCVFNNGFAVSIKGLIFTDVHDIGPNAQCLEEEIVRTPRKAGRAEAKESAYHR
jgi:hypothetical protein